jgi:hypothetical protein
MSDGAAIAAGLIIGLIIVLPIFIANRHTMARNIHFLFGKSSATDRAASVGEVNLSDKLSLTVVAYGCCCAVLSIGVGAILGELFLVITGAVLLTSVVLTAIVSRRLRLSPPSEKNSAK